MYFWDLYFTYLCALLVNLVSLFKLHAPGKAKWLSEDCGCQQRSFIIRTFHTNEFVTKESSLTLNLALSAVPLLDLRRERRSLVRLVKILQRGVCWMNVGIALVASSGARCEVKLSQSPGCPLPSCTDDSLYCWSVTRGKCCSYWWWKQNPSVSRRPVRNWDYQAVL